MRRGNVLENLIDFGAVLRAHGLQVHTGRLIDVAQALQQIDLGSRDEVFHTCRTLLIHRHEDFPVFDRVFWSSFDEKHRGRAGSAERSGSDAEADRCTDARCAAMRRSLRDLERHRRHRDARILRR